ncbi:MAG: hypothetical protein GXP10_10505 [Gammaproteobacteria bacterium]|nr:hypothetical protein [Gammaproteobacteria bacterium]
MSALYTDLSKLSGAFVQCADQIHRSTLVVGEQGYQTNLLALNTAIEAARSGAQGRSTAQAANELSALGDSLHKFSAEVIQRVSAVRLEFMLAEVNAGDQSLHTREFSNHLNEAAVGFVELADKVHVIVSCARDLACVAAQWGHPGADIESRIKGVRALTQRSVGVFHSSNEIVRRLLALMVELEQSMLPRSGSRIRHHQLRFLNDYATQIRMNTLLAVNSSHSRAVTPYVVEINRLDKKLDAVWRRYADNLSTLREERLAKTFMLLWQDFLVARAFVLNYAAQGNFFSAKENAAKEAGPKFRLARNVLTELIACGSHRRNESLVSNH